MAPFPLLSRWGARGISILTRPSIRCNTRVQCQRMFKRALEAMPSIFSAHRFPQRLPCLQTVGVIQLPSNQRRICAAAASEGVGAPGAAARRVAGLFAQQPTLCLERAVADKHGIDQNLWDSCHFQAEIYPDLPLASTWRDLLRRTLSAGGHESEAGSVEPPAARCPAERWTVRTVAAQLRSRDQLRTMMLSAAGVDESGDAKPGVRSCDALLFVSGSHPARHLPGAGRYVVAASSDRALTKWQSRNHEQLVVR